MIILKNFLYIEKLYEFGRDGDDEIMDLDNFQGVLGEVGLDGYHPEMIQMFKEADRNGDNELSRKEFGKLIENLVRNDHFEKFVDGNMHIDYSQLEDAIAEASKKQGLSMEDTPSQIVSVTLNLIWQIISLFFSAFLNPQMYER